ncbi:MAG: protease inhibitor I42 family protein [Coriobacteriia bacterium]
MIALAALLMALLSGCSKPADTGGSGSGAKTGPVVVTAADADKTVTVAPGQTLEVVLDANPSTGYTWTIASAPEFLKSEGEPVFASEGASGAVGAGGKQTMKFSVTAAGTGSLSLNYVRPWEAGVAPAETFKVEVDSK